jgi:hypothetical protein
VQDWQQGIKSRTSLTSCSTTATAAPSDDSSVSSCTCAEKRGSERATFLAGSIASTACSWCGDLEKTVSSACPFRASCAGKKSNGLESSGWRSPEKSGSTAQTRTFQSRIPRTSSVGGYDLRERVIPRVFSRLFSSLFSGFCRFILRVSFVVTEWEIS